MSEPPSLPIVQRYAEVDRQSVVFDGHHLTWFDEAPTAFWMKGTIPAEVRAALTSVAGQGRNASIGGSVGP